MWYYYCSIASHKHCVISHNLAYNILKCIRLKIDFAVHSYFTEICSANCNSWNTRIDSDNDLAVGRRWSNICTDVELIDNYMGYKALVSYTIV